MEQTVLYMDIGNTAIKYYVYTSTGFKLIMKEPSKVLDAGMSIFKLANFGFKFTKLILSCTKPSIYHHAETIATAMNIKIYDIKKNISLKPFFDSNNIKPLGADLIALMIGSFTYSDNSIIISLGTATVLSITVNGSFTGCIIMPGIVISATALFENAELLNNFNYKVTDKNIDIMPPKNTADAISLGILKSHLFMIESWILRISMKYPEIVFAKIFCGGYVDKILPLIKDKYLIDEFLLAKGLRQLEKNI